MENGFCRHHGGADPSKAVSVALPLGIGDAHWTMQKIRALKALHGGAPIHLHINESPHHKTVGYLRMFRFVDKAFMNPRAPFSIHGELPGTYRDARYQTLDGCRNWRGFDYVLVANHAMESGTPIAEWVPALETQYRFRYRFPEGTDERVRALMPEPAVLLYLSGRGPNAGFHNGWWTVANWREVVRLLNRSGIEPLVVGANTQDDIGYFRDFEQGAAALSYRSVVGQTSIPEYVRLIECSRAWCGLNSGGGIVAASAETPTIMMWADSRWPVGGAHFKPEMQRAWLCEKQLRRYRTHSYGNPETTPDAVAASIAAVMR